MIKNRPAVLATAEFTQDMAQTLVEYFTAYERNGVVEIYVTDRGLWLKNPVTSNPQFLGSASVLNDDRTH